MAHAKGDLEIGKNSIAEGILPVGSDTQILIADSAQTLGIKWGAAPTGSAPWTPADTAASAGAFDEEMNGALAGAWIWQASSGVPVIDNSFTDWSVNNVIANPRYSQGVYIPHYLIFQAMAATNMKVYRAMPAGFTAGVKWVVGAKVRLMTGCTQDDRVSLSLFKEVPSSSADEPVDGFHTHIRTNGSAGTSASSQIRSYSKSGGGVASEIDTGTAMADYTCYIAYVQDTDNRIRSFASNDGMSWGRFLTQGSIAANGNINYVALTVSDSNADAGAPAIAAVDWIRFRLGTTDPNALYLT